MQSLLQCDAPYRGHLTKFFTNYLTITLANLIDSHASLQSSHSCKLNTVAWVVELTYLHVVVKCESLLGGQGKARCTVKNIFRSSTKGVFEACPSRENLKTFRAYVKQQNAIFLSKGKRLMKLRNYFAFSPAENILKDQVS